MINLIDTEKSKALREIIQLNPFDAVVILQQNENHFSVEMINAKAALLFNDQFLQGMDAEKFFQTIHWFQIYPLVLSPNNEVNYITLQSSKQLAIHVQPIVHSPKRLISVVMRLVSNDVTAAFEAQLHDELTGLLNRRALNERWPILKGHTELNLALLLVDLDRFKKFNESLGKKKADDMLAIVSNRFKRLRSEFCEIFRYNGDEFVFLVRYYSREEVEILAKNILDILREPLVVDNQDYFVTASIGIAASRAGQTAELDTLLHKADQALFYVKNHGRNHFRFYSKEMSQVFPNEALLEAHLCRAIELGELTLHLQPQIDLYSKTIDSFEALIRWNNRKFGSVPPSQFIPLAESSGLILDIGDWVFERVCQYQQEWQRKGYRPVRIAVNISPKQFKQEEFVEKIQHILNQYDVKPELIELEITESSMTNVNETTAILTRLKELGVFVSVDDFGTGYSSLSYLKKYPIDFIKIDQSFIADIENDKKNEAIIKAIILLSHNLGLEVVAEGVEQKNQEQFLYENHCERVQGYLYNKPLPVEQIIEQYFVG